MTVVNKDIPSKRNILGQFLTPPEVAAFCVSKIQTDAELIVEPSFGEGVFFAPLRKKFPDKAIWGLELDPEMFAKYQGPEYVYNDNFYNFTMPPFKSVSFVGNPPYRSPAYSLTTHKEYINYLRKEYKIEGIREEAVLFILHTFHTAKFYKVACDAHYILPRAIFQNNSKVFTKFANFLNINFGVRAVWDLGQEFDSVSRNLVFVSFSCGPKSETILLNDKPIRTEDWLGGGRGIVPFQKIFKKTYLGSVPCESVFLSCRNEPVEHFRDRMLSLFGPEKLATEDQILQALSYQGVPHLRALQKGDRNKLAIVQGYIEEARSLPDFSPDLFVDLNNYKPIRHREEDRWYFRHDFLKRGSFVYQLNSNPCPSFTFPGNPSSSSKDYFDFVPYDMNRNSGPGAQRLIPVDDVENNLTDWFKEEYWPKELPYKMVPYYLQWIGRSEWYRQIKKMNERFYFGVPEKFNVAFLEESHVEESFGCGRRC